MIAQLEIENVDETIDTVFLEADQKGTAANEFEAKLSSRIVGREQVVRQTSDLYQVFLAGMNPPNQRVGTMLFLGPTGSGKTRVVEAAAEVLFGDPRDMVKIDCAEFQHSHEIAKLIGSPPVYLGHRETQPLITQEVLEQHHTESLKISLVLFDEIEKASDALWQLLLGILDKAALTLGDNRRVDFSQSLVFLTSNLGSQEITKLMNGGMGYASGPQEDNQELDQKIYRTATDAARRKFSAEFMNRIDKVIVFRTLKRKHLETILDFELGRVQERIMSSAASRQFVFSCTASARDFLLEEGTDSRSGARHLKRAIERHLVFPLSNLLATDQIQFGDLVTIDYATETSKLIFLKENPGAPAGVSNGTSATEPVLAFASGVSASTSRVWTSDAEDRMAG